MNSLKEASKDPEQMKKWWSLWPDANIGIATGLISKIVVLDIDNDDETGENGTESLLKWAHGEQYNLPDTWQALTGGGGVHFFYRPSIKIPNRTKVLPGIDVRGDGGYIVAPPSNHVSGKNYEWEISPDDMPEPIRLPPEIYTLMIMRQTSGSFSFTSSDYVSKGARNTTMFKLASSLKAKGIFYEAILAAVSAENAQRCSPALGVREIETICGSVEKYKSGEALNQMQMAASAETVIGQEAISGTVESLVSEETMQSIFIISNELERARKIMTLRKRAQALHCVRDFNKILKFYSDKLTQKAAKEDRLFNMTSFSNAPLSLKCGDYMANDKGVVGSESNVCPHPILPIASLTDVDTGTERTELAFSHVGIWKTAIVDRPTLASRTAIISLADRGVAVNSENAKFLIQYFADIEAMNEGLIPQYKSVSNLGWTGSSFSPYMQELKFSGDEAYRGLFEAVRCEGDYGLWKETAENVRTQSFIGRIALNASFAAPIVGMLRKLIFFVHFWGGSGKAKTVALMLAMSVWGNPELSNGLVRTFNATLIGLERLAGFMRSIPLALDELQCKSGDKNNFEGLIYMLGQGQGRTRGRKAGGIEAIPTWRNCIISTGEQPLTDDHSGGGAKNRVKVVISTRQTLKILIIPKLKHKLVFHP